MKNNACRRNKGSVVSPHLGIKELFKPVLYRQPPSVLPTAEELCRVNKSTSLHDHTPCVSMCQQFTAWSYTSAMDSAHSCEILQLCSTAPHLAFYFFVRSHNNNDNNVSCVSLGRAHQPKAAVAARTPRGLVRKSSPAEAGRHSRHDNNQQHRRGRGAAAGESLGEKERRTERGGVHPPPLLFFYT